MKILIFQQKIFHFKERPQFDYLTLPQPKKDFFRYFEEIMIFGANCQKRGKNWKKGSVLMLILQLFSQLKIAESG